MVGLYYGSGTRKTQGSLLFQLWFFDRNVKCCKDSPDSDVMFWRRASKISRSLFRWDEEHAVVEQRRVVARRPS